MKHLQTLLLAISCTILGGCATQWHEPADFCTDKGLKFDYGRFVLTPGRQTLLSAKPGGLVTTYEPTEILNKWDTPPARTPTYMTVDWRFQPNVCLVAEVTKYCAIVDEKYIHECTGS